MGFLEQTAQLRADLTTQIKSLPDGAAAVLGTAEALLALHAAHTLKIVVEVVVVVRQLEWQRT